MAVPTIKGVNGVTEQPRVERGSDGTGATTIRTWQGPKAKIETFIARNRRAFGDDYEVTRSGGVSSVTVQFAGGQMSTASGGGDEVETEFELIPQRIEKDLRTLPRWTQSTTGETDNTTRAKWFAAADVFLDTLVESDLTRLGPAATVPTWVWNYIRCRQLGVDTYPTCWYILRVTETISSASSRKASTDTDWTVTTTNPTTFHPYNPQIRASDPKFTVPTTVGTPPQTIYWMITPAEVRKRGKGRVAIVREYWGAAAWITEKVFPVFA